MDRLFRVSYLQYTKQFWRKRSTLFFLLSLSVSLVGKTEEPALKHSKENSSKSTPTDQLIPFFFTKKNLLSLLEEIAEKKQIQLILPIGAGLEALKKQLITYEPKKSQNLPLDEAWRLISTFLELSGFSLFHKKENTYGLLDMKLMGGSGAARETLPLYVETPPEKLPASAEPIRYLFGLKNIQVPRPPERANHPLNTMLKQLLSPTALILFESGSNTIIMTDKASQIASILPILQEIDNRGFKELIDYVPLKFLPAAQVVNIFDSLRKASGEQPLEQPAGSAPSYFSQETRLIAHESNNAVIVMGKESSVERISEFIRKNLDQAPESGNSILHSYDLQYLDAETFAPLLQKAISTLIEGSSPQAGQQIKPEGYERLLDGVIVLAEPLVEVRQKATTEKDLLEKAAGMEALGIEGIQKVGGNRLVVAATKDNWEIVKELIKKLDSKRKQVLLEMFIIDFTYDNQTILASDLRNKTSPCSDQPGVQFLASHISPPSDVLGATPVQLAQDLLQITGPQEIARKLTPGSLLISLNDPVTPGIFGLLQVLQKVVTAKIQSHPYLVVTDHQTGSIESEEIRYIQGNLVTTTNGTFTIPFEDVTATLRVVATPHIATDNRIRLEISFTADEFVSTNSNTRLTRELKTTATLASGQILAMGGLLRNDTLVSASFTPILGKVPLAGIFFRGNNRDDTVTNIVLLVSPIIVEPRSTLALKKNYAQDKIEEVILYENSIENPRDPLYRLFFKEESTLEAMRDFFLESSNMQDIPLPPYKPPVKLIPQRKRPLRTGKPFRIDELKELLACNAPLPRLRNNKSSIKV